MTTLDPARLTPAPRPSGQEDAASSAAWLETLDVHAMEHGFHARLGQKHGALYTEDDERMLLVSFENAVDIRNTTPALPHGLKVAGKSGWSQLTLFSEGDTWFRDPEVYAFFDDLVDDGFFDLFDDVMFYGVGPGGYAACAYSVAAPFSKVLAIRPQATLDPARAGWDRRFLKARRASFTDRYGDAVTLLEASERAALVYDPLIAEDAMHASLFGAAPMHLHTPMLGRHPETLLEGMGVIEAMLRLLAKDRLTQASFASLYQRRKRSAGYLRQVLQVLEEKKRPLLQALWCRAALRETDRPRLRKGLEEAVAALEAAGRSLPPPRPPHAPAVTSTATR